MNVDEVLAKMDTLDANEEEIQYIIDENLRIISIPPLGVVLGVEGDKDVNSVKFKMVRYYKGIDLSKFEIRINFANANGDLSYYTVKNPTVTDDTLTFEWLVGYLVTKYKGTVRFVVRMIITDSSTGEVQQAFDTTIGEARSLEGLLVDVPTDEKVYDIVAQLKTDLTDHVNNLLKTIPEDYNELTKKVENNALGISDLKEDFIDKQVNNWLDEHPEATTTVQNHSLTIDKMVIGTLGYVTPEMFGAVGDGKTDDTAAIQNMFNICDVAYFCGSKTYVCSAITIKDSVKNVIFNGCNFIKSKKGTLFTYENVNNIDISNFSVTRKGQGISGPILSVYGKNYKICNVEVIKSEDVEAPTNGWCFKLEGDNVLVENCIIYNNYGESYDGIHFGCCSNVIIRNCNIFSGDDCIAFYPQPSSQVSFHYHRNELSKNLLIENCNLQCTNPYSAIKLGTSDNISNYGVELIIKDCIINTKIIIGNPGFTNPINNNVVKMIGCKCTGDGTSSYGLFQINKDFGTLVLQDCEVYSKDSVNRVINSGGNNVILIDKCNIESLKKSIGYYINDNINIKDSKLITYETVVVKACNFYIFNSEFERINQKNYGFSIAEINGKEMVVIGSRILSVLQGSLSTSETANLLISKDNIGVSIPITNFDATNKYYELGNRKHILSAETLKGASAETTDMLKIEVNGVGYWIPVLQA